jgi:hypothetical protein
MKLLEKALDILKKPITLDSMREWDKLCKQARGSEAQQIGELYETLLDELSASDFDLYMAELADWAESQT